MRFASPQGGSRKCRRRSAGAARLAVAVVDDGAVGLMGVLAAKQMGADRAIIDDKDEQFGQPVVTNGLPLSKIDHAAFDANLIGINPDYRVHVSDALLSVNDGPML